MKSTRLFFFFQAEDGIRDLVRSRGLGDVYKRQVQRLEIQVVDASCGAYFELMRKSRFLGFTILKQRPTPLAKTCLLYTSDAADERSSVDLGGRRIIKKKNTEKK